MNHTEAKAPLTMEQKVDEIYYYLKGNPLDKEDGGLIASHRALKNRVWRLERFKDRAAAYLAGAMAVVVVVWTVLSRLIPLK